MTDTHSTYKEMIEMLSQIYINDGEEESIRARVITEILIAKEIPPRVSSLIVAFDKANCIEITRRRGYNQDDINALMILTNISQYEAIEALSNSYNMVREREQISINRFMRSTNTSRNQAIEIMDIKRKRIVYAAMVLRANITRKQRKKEIGRLMMSRVPMTRQDCESRQHTH